MMESNNSNGSTLSVKLVPNDVMPEDFEELLANDRFFRDCFNEFLAQPVFGEPLHFNPITFGFELKSAERDNVVSMIREAVYYARPKPHCQKITNIHAFRPIPLLPMEFDVKDPPNVKSEYSVDMLESEKANYWLKQKRLPMFLNSDLYHYYRMGHMLAQAAAIYRSSGRTTVIYDDKPTPKKAAKKVALSEKFALEDTYVCYGASGTTDTSQRYTNSAMSKGGTTPSFSSGFSTPRLSEMLSRPKSARPKSSNTASRPESSLARPSVTPLSEAVTADSGRDSEDEWFDSSFNRDLRSARSVIPLPSELICVAERSPLGPLEVPTQNKEEDNIRIPPSVDPLATMTENQSRSESRMLMAEETNEGLAGLEKCPDPGIAQALISALRKAFPDRGVTPELMLSRLMLNPHFERIVNHIPNFEQVRNMNVRSLIERAEMMEQEEGEVGSISGDVFPPDEDRELGEDGKGVHSISNLEVLRAFEKFMKKSSGWPIFNLWLDIDRLQRKLGTESLQLTPPIRQFLSSMRQRYLKAGGEFGLSASVQEQLELSDLDDWTAPHLLAIQPQLMQMLLSYWAIRFLVHENSRTKEFLKNSVEYQLFKSELVGYEQPIYHEPKTPTVLPLRPKTCMPRPKPVVKPVKQNRFNSSFTQVVLPPPNPPGPEMPFRRSCLVPIEGESPPPEANAEQRAKTAPAHRVKPEKSQEKETFFGSAGMEKLLKALGNEPFTGHFLEQFIRQTNNKTWLNALLFWLELQKYHKFFNETFITADANAVKSLANQLFSTYIMPGTKDAVGVSKIVANRISDRLDPPYEELFDEAEEYVISVLNEALKEIEKEAESSLSTIGKQTYIRKIETSNSEILNLNSLGVFRQANVLPKDDEDVSVTTASLLPTEENKQAYWDQVPEQFRDYTLENVILSRDELEAFRQFLEANNIAIDLFCWMDIEAYRRLPPGSDQLMHFKATDVKEKYLNKKYFFGAGSPATKQEQTTMIEKHGGWGKLMAFDPPPALLMEVQIYARRRLDSKWLPQFLATQQFADLKRPVEVVVNTEEDDLAAKRRRAAQVAKMLEGHWSTTAQEALMFRNALSSDDTRKLFHRFLKLRTNPGEFLANDLEFYNEVQKYKQLYHTHADESLINAKVAQISTCYLEDTHRTPSLQIDIPHELAEKIVWHRKDLGAYLFREAQLTVFRILLSHWADFCRFRETIPVTIEQKVRTVRIGGKIYPMKPRPPKTTAIDPAHFMEALERRKIIIDKKRQLKEKEAAMAKQREDDESSEAVSELIKKDAKARPAQDHALDEEEGPYNPFGGPQQSSRKGTWRYSDYQYALERELLLNQTNKETFMLDEQEFGKAVDFFPNLFDQPTTANNNS